MYDGNGDDFGKSSRHRMSSFSGSVDVSPNPLTDKAYRFSARSERSGWGVWINGTVLDLVTTVANQAYAMALATESRSLTSIFQCSEKDPSFGKRDRSLTTSFVAHCDGPVPTLTIFDVLEVMALGLGHKVCKHLGRTVPRRARGEG